MASLRSLVPSPLYRQATTPFLVLSLALVVGTAPAMGAAEKGEWSWVGVTLIIHNKGLSYSAAKPGEWRYRLAPELIAPQGKYEWLNSSLFISTLSEVPPEMRLAKGAKENDRLIQIYRVL